MKKSRVLVAVCAIVTMIAGSVFALEIDVAPNVLVMKSKGGKVTVHTDVLFVEAESVSMDVNGTPIDVYTFPDCLGFLVAQCPRDDVKDIIDDLDGETTTPSLTLTVDGDSATEELQVKK